MSLSRVGPLHADKTIPEWQVSEPVTVPYFDGAKLEFVFDGLDHSTREPIDRVLKAFFALGAADREKAGPYVFTCYRNVIQSLDPSDRHCDIAGAKEVWNHVRPDQIFVSGSGKTNTTYYVQITAECDWEPEHGLQIVYRDGSTLSRVSEQDGHLTHSAAYGLPESEDRIVEGSAAGAEPTRPWWKIW